tara:strand:- start:254 stop:532 length:279 start_codon:yes stop_codon:yes gene_type:complete
MCNIIIYRKGLNKMKSKIWYNKQRNELQCYDKSVAVKAFKKGYDVYCTSGLNTSLDADDYKLTNLDDLINVEQALFIIENISMANLLDLEVL